MAFIPCPIHVNCPPGLGSLEFDSPLANFSSEAPDPNLFTAINYGQTQTPPNLDCSFVNSTAVGVCQNTDPTQAELCAVNQQLVNLLGTWRCPGTPPPPPPNIGPQFPPAFPVVPQPPPIDTGQPPSPPIFFNALQTCPFICPDGLPFVWTVAAGTITQTTQPLADAIAKSIACQLASVHFMCLSGITPSGCSGAAYSSTITCEKGIAVKTPLSYSVISGTLPPGLVTAQSTDSLSFFISGTPTTPGTYNFTVQVTDANGNFMQKPYTVTILGMTNLASLGQPTVARPFSAQLNAAGGTAPYTFSLVDSLPAGLTVNSAGLISGTVSVHYLGNFTSTFQVTDANNLQCTGVWKSNTKEPPGPDWTTLVWTNFVLNQGTAANSVSGQGIAQNASASLVLNSNLANVSISPVQTSGVAYTGPQVVCEFQVIVTAWDPNAGFTFAPNHSVAGQLPVSGGPITGVGTWNLTFTVPASVGATISFADQSPGNHFAFLPANMFFGTALKQAFTLQLFNV